MDIYRQYNINTNTNTVSSDIELLRFFRQLLTFFALHQMALSLFRFIAALGRVQVVANTLGTFTILLVFVLGGFIIAKGEFFPCVSYSFSLQKPR